MTKCLFVAPLFLVLSAWAEPVDDKESNGASYKIPDYKIINAQSKNSSMQWYVSDYFKKVEQWELESTDISTLQHGMYELTQYPNKRATQSQKEAGDAFIKATTDSIVRHGWFSKKKGLSDGYEQMYGDPVHYVNKAYVFDGETLNPDKPEVLMYYKKEEREFLMGVMFIAAGQRGPQVAGPLSKWHYHIEPRFCYERGVLPIGKYKAGGSCKEGFPNTRSPEMLHVWIFDHADGRFATRMGLSEKQLRFGIRQVLNLEKERIAK